MFAARAPGDLDGAAGDDGEKFTINYRTEMALRFLTAGESHGKALLVFRGLPGPGASPADINQNWRAAARPRRGNRRNRNRRSRFWPAYAMESRTGCRSADFKNWERSCRRNANGAVEGVEVPRPNHGRRDQIPLHDMRNVLERSSARSGCGSRSARSPEISQSLRHKRGQPRRADRASQRRHAVCGAQRAGRRSPVRCTNALTEKKMVAVIDKAGRRHQASLRGVRSGHGGAGFLCPMGSCLKGRSRLRSCRSTPSRASNRVLCGRGPSRLLGSRRVCAGRQKSRV